MNAKRFLVLMITVATTGMMGACSTEPEPEPPTGTERLVAGWEEASLDSKVQVCDSYYTLPEMTAETLSEEGEVEVWEATDFLDSVC